MFIPEAALEELATAEATLMSFVARSSEALAHDDSDDDAFDAVPMMLAVVRAISTSRGLLMAQKMIDEMSTEIPVSLGHLPDRFCGHCGAEVGS